MTHRDYNAHQAMDRTPPSWQRPAPVRQTRPSAPQRMDDEDRIVLVAIAVLILIAMALL